MNDNQLGSVPVALNDAVGVPVVRTVKVPSISMVKVVLAGLVMAGACGVGGVSCTVSLKFWVALGRVPLTAVIVIG